MPSDDTRSSDDDGARGPRSEPKLISPAEATAVLDYFCDGATRTDHAVMIDAPWGAGKTHFIKAYLESRDAAARKEADFIGAPFLYASFYGVSTSDEIREQFFTQAHPVLSSRPVKLLGSALAGVVKKFTGAEFDKDETSLQALLPRLDARVLVFDDLERAAMPVVDALGLINRFVEHGDFKVIVIANQTEIPEAQRAEYARQREKIIGRTLTIRADPSAVLEALIAELHNDTAREAAAASSELIIRVFEASETHNLRSLRAALADFDRLVGALDPKLATSAEAVRRLLLFITATEIELRKGLTRRELDCLLSVRIAFGAIKPSETPEVKKAEALQAKYRDVEWRDPIIPGRVLADFLVTGVLDVDAANQAILIHPLIAEPRATPAWRRLIQWQLTGAEAYRQDRADVLDEIGRQAIVEPGEICHVAGIALWLESMDAPLFDDVEQTMTHYVDAVEAAKTLRPNRSIFTGSFQDAWAGMVFCSVEDPRLGRIKAHLGAAVERMFSQRMKEAAPALLDRLRQAGNDGSLLFEGGEGDGVYGGVAILHNIDAGAFADLLVRDGQANRELSASLVRRYQHWGHEPELQIERPWLEALKQEIEARAAKLGPPFERALTGAFSKMFGEIFGLLDFMAANREPPLAVVETA